MESGLPERRGLRSWLPVGALLSVAILLAVGAASASHAPATARVAPAGAAVATGPVPPHPDPIPVSALGMRPAGPMVHWWAGSYFTGTAFNSTQLTVTLKVPDATPSSSEFYYVLLSVWDDAGSYDQIGFSNDYGTWGWTWSYTSNCAGTYYYTPNQVPLTRGVQYTFTMNISGGNLTFGVEKAGVFVHSLVKHSGGTHFLDQAFYTCSSTSYYDYTDYEESYAVVQAMPSFDLFFTANTANNATVVGWTSFSAPPGGGSIIISKSNTTVENEPFALAFLKGPDSAKLAKATTDYFTNVSVRKILTGGSVNLTASGSAGAFTISFSTKSGTPAFTTMVHVVVKTVTTGVHYAVTITAKNAAGVYTYLTLVLTFH